MSHALDTFRVHEPMLVQQGRSIVSSVPWFPGHTHRWSGLLLEVDDDHNRMESNLAS